MLSRTAGRDYITRQNRPQQNKERTPASAVMELTMFANANRLFAFAGIACLCLSLITFLRPAPCDETKNEYFTGKVVSLAKILEKAGGRLDAVASPHWLALVTEEVKAYPIIKDDGSRMFFLDSALLDRPMR